MGSSKKNIDPLQIRRVQFAQLIECVSMLSKFIIDHSDLNIIYDLDIDHFYFAISARAFITVGLSAFIRVGLLQFRLLSGSFRWPDDAFLVLSGEVILVSFLRKPLGLTTLETLFMQRYPYRLASVSNPPTILFFFFSKFKGLPSSRTMWESIFTIRSTSNPASILLDSLMMVHPGIYFLQMSTMLLLPMKEGVSLMMIILDFFSNILMIANFLVIQLFTLLFQKVMCESKPLKS